jgi:PST family polysaccharide transporter
VLVQLALAVAGMGAMAVAIGQVTSATIAFVAVMVCSHWRPTLEFRPSSLRGEMGYNAGMLGTSFATYLGKNVDYWFVGRVCGPTALGVYYVAFVLPNILRQRITTVAGAVMFPVFVRHQHDPAQLRRTYVESFGLHLMAGVPAMCGLSLVADDVVAVFFGSQWAAAGTLLAILSLAAAAEFVTAAAISMFLATGRTRDTVLLQLFRAVLLAGGLSALAWSPADLDPTSAAAVVLGSTAAAALAAQMLACRRLGISPDALFVGLRAVLPPTAVMTAGLWGIQRADVGSHALSLAGSAVCGGALFLAAGFLFGRLPFRLLLAECLRIALPERVHTKLTSLEVGHAG